MHAVSVGWSLLGTGGGITHGSSWDSPLPAHLVARCSCSLLFEAK